jgi:hypothetical protein
MQCCTNYPLLVEGESLHANKEQSQDPGKTTRLLL